jgi:hypothetical protein
MRRSDLLDMLRATDYVLVGNLGLRQIAARTLSMFSGVGTVLTLPSGFLFVAEPWFETCVPISSRCCAQEPFNISQC